MAALGLGGVPCGTGYDDGGGGCGGGTGYDDGGDGCGGAFGEATQLIMLKGYDPADATVVENAKLDVEDIDAGNLQHIEFDWDSTPDGYLIMCFYTVAHARAFFPFIDKTKTGHGDTLEASFINHGRPPTDR